MNQSFNRENPDLGSQDLKNLTERDQEQMAYKIWESEDCNLNNDIKLAKVHPGDFVTYESDNDEQESDSKTFSYFSSIFSNNEARNQGNIETANNEAFMF